MIHKLSENKWDQQAKKILLKICRTEQPTPYWPDFKDSQKLTKRLILFGLNYSFSGSEYQTEFIDAFRANGETGFFISYTEYSKTQRIRNTNKLNYHWYVPIENSTNYGRQIHFLENVTFSENATWGVLFSHEQHAVMICTPSLLNELELRIPNLHDQVYEFLKLWKRNKVHYGLDYPWMQPLLEHVYGKNKGTFLLEFYDEYSPNFD